MITKCRFQPALQSSSATENANGGIQVPITTLKCVGSFWIMETGVTICKPLVQSSKNGNELPMQTSPHSLQYTKVDYTMVRQSHANKMTDILCCGHITILARLYVQCSSVRLFYTCFTVVAAYVVRVEMSRQGKLSSWRPIMLPRWYSLTC